MPAWHQLIPMLGHVEKSETDKIATMRDFHVPGSTHDTSTTSSASYIVGF